MYYVRKPNDLPAEIARNMCTMEGKMHFPTMEKGRVFHHSDMSFSTTMEGKVVSDGIVIICRLGT